MRFFSNEEFNERITRVRQALRSSELDACIITNPENIYYLTGLNHQGYFAYTSLILSVDHAPVLIMRAMEEMIVQDMVIPSVEFFPYSDGVEPSSPPENREEDLMMSARTEDALQVDLQPSPTNLGVAVSDSTAEILDYSNPAKVTCEALRKLKLTSARVAFEKNSSFMPYKVAEEVVNDLPDVKWFDAGDLINDCRIIQSPAELVCTRRAAAVSDAMILSGIAMAGPGVPCHDVAAQVYSAMLQRGGTYPAFVPLIRSMRTLHHEHGTWDHSKLNSGEHLFLEMSGCYWRYHAPVGRLVYIGKASKNAISANKVCLEALLKVVDTIKPGVTADSIYQAWKATIDKAGYEHYNRHHCGYLVGIGFPPSWSGSGVPRSLRRGSDMVVKENMVFHLLSWLMRTGKGDAFISDTVVVTKNGCELLTKAPRDLIIR